MEQEIKGIVESLILYYYKDTTLEGKGVLMTVHSWKPHRDGPIRSYLKDTLTKYGLFDQTTIDRYVKIVAGATTYYSTGNNSRKYTVLLSYDHGYKYCAVLDSIEDAASAIRVKRAARIKQINDSKTIRSILPPEIANIVLDYTVNTIDVFN